MAPGARRGGRSGRAPRPRRRRVAPARGSPAADADAQRDGRGIDPDRAADDDRDRAHVDHDRHDARRARPHRLPHRRRGRGAQRVAVDDPSGRRPPDLPRSEGPADPILRRAPPAGRDAGRVQERRVQRRAHRWRALPRLARPVHPRDRGPPTHRGGRAVRLRLLRRRRQGRPRIRLRGPLRCRAGGGRRARRRAARRRAARYRHRRDRRPRTGPRG